VGRCGYLYPTLLDHDRAFLVSGARSDVTLELWKDLGTWDWPDRLPK